MARADQEAPRKVHGPRVPGAQAKPKVGKVRKLTEKPPSRQNRKNLPPAKDEVERAERYVAKQQGGGPSAHALKMRRVQRLKELIEPLTPSLIQVMSDIAHDTKVHPAVRLDAADRLLNRLYGKPAEKVEISDPGDDEPVDEVRTLLNNILESVGAPRLEFHDEPTPPKPTKEADDAEKE